jgi:taurine transport system permease protein
MKKVSILISCATVLAIMVVWFAATNLETINPVFLPSPKRVWQAFIALCQDGYKSYTFWQHISSSLERISIAFGLAVVTAVPLGLVSGYTPWLKAVFEPIVEFIRPLPPLAYYTLIVIWLGIDNESKIMLLYIACFMPIYVACVSAVIRVPKAYVWNALALGANKRQVFFRVVLPSALPEIFLSMRISLGGGYATLVSSEMIAARSGIGWMVLDASNFLRGDMVFAGVIVMGIVAIAFDQILRALKRIFVFWEGKDIN